MVPDTRSVVSRNSVVDDSVSEETPLKETTEAKKTLSKFQQDEINKAQDLKDKGIITEDEFNVLREKILKL